MPHLINYSDDLWTIEIDIVANPPYVIDFAKVRIDRPPHFPEDGVQMHEEKCVEIFRHHWPEVQNLIASLESIGIYYLDPQLGNIVFADLQ